MKASHQSFLPIFMTLCCGLAGLVQAPAALALVEYGEPSKGGQFNFSAPGNPSGGASPGAAPSLPRYNVSKPSEVGAKGKSSEVQSFASTGGSRGGVKGGGEHFFRFNTTYDSLRFGSGMGDASGSRVGLYRMQLGLETPYNIFINGETYFAQSESKALNPTDKPDKFWQGNSLAILGFNWLALGEAHERVKIDLYGGMQFPLGNSSFASTRTDYVAGMSTTKTFYNFALGLEAEIRMMGAPKSEQELAVGNLTQLALGLGWLISSDIRLEVEGQYVRMSAYSKDERINRLKKDVTYSGITSRLFLGITSGVEWLLGGSFQGKKLADSNIASARLYNMKNIYGNSLFTGLQITL
jgi:hypothetical protein